MKHGLHPAGILLAITPPAGLALPPWHRWFGPVFAATALASSLSAAETTPAKAGSPAEFGWMDIDQLSQVRIVTASRFEQPAFTTPAAQAVLGNDDVKRAGATSIPEALRWVPGLNVAQMGGNTWAVGARGFQWQFANKLQVLIDGRSVYSPFFGGVTWENQFVYLDDVDRIEVIRGPGSSVWGANAVNGVINVVSRSAFDTLGTDVFAGGGNELLAYTGARQGVKLSDTAAIRFYGQYRATDDDVLPNGNPADDSTQVGQGGFRLDWKPAENSKFTLQGDILWQDSEYQRTFQTLAAPPTYQTLSDTDTYGRGANVLGRWQRSWADESHLELQAYWDWSNHDTLSYETEFHTFDTDLVYARNLGERQKASAGLTYRYIDGTINPGFLGILREHDQTQLFSSFLQDEIAIVPERLALTLGSKFEHNDFTGWEIQPGARLAWTPTDNHTVWSAVTRAVRTPTWIETFAAFDARVYPPGVINGTLPTTIRVFGNSDLASEKMTAYEIGARWKVRDRLSFDVAGFYYDYDDYVFITSTGSSIQADPPAEILSQHYDNGITGESYGGELAARWDACSWWRLDASYSYVQIQLHANGSDPFSYEQDEATTPHNTVRLQSAMQFSRQWELDLGGRYVDSVPYYSVPPYFELDARLAWRPSKHWELSIVGKNLLDAQHPEYDTALYRRMSELERSVLLIARSNF